MKTSELKELVSRYHNGNNKLHDDLIDYAYDEFAPQLLHILRSLGADCGGRLLYKSK